MSAPEDHNLIDAVIADHRELEALFVELEHERADGDPQRCRQLVDHVITEVVRHSVAEEHYLYPQVRMVLYDGDEIADHAIDEDAAAEALMKRLEAFDVTDPEFSVLLEQLIQDIRRHVEDEEHNLLPRLRTMCGLYQLRELAEKFQAIKQTAPTRPHPAAPNSPSGNRTPTPGAGLIGRLRDALTAQSGPPFVENTPTEPPRGKGL